MFHICGMFSIVESIGEGGMFNWEKDVFVSKVSQQGVFIPRLFNELRF